MAQIYTDEIKQGDACDEEIEAGTSREGLI